MAKSGLNSRDAGCESPHYDLPLIRSHYQTVDFAMAGNETLRRDLDEASALRSQSEYRIRLENLKGEHGHTVVVLEDGNCFAYALGAWDEPSYRQLVHEWQSSSLIDSQFVSEMIVGSDLAELPPNEIQPGSVVLYFDGERLRHAGLVEDATAEPVIRSKWGGNEVHRHKLWEVPSPYGDCVRFYRAPDPQAILARLKADLEEN
jgi:hypothetical protein